MSEEIIDMGYDAGATGLVINEQIKTELRKTAKWTTFLAVLGFIAIGVMVLSSLYMLSNASSGYGYFSEQLFAMGVTYIIVAIIYFFPVYFLMKFSTKMKDALGLGGQMSLNEAFGYMRKQYQFVGILAIVIISIYIIVILGALSMVGRF
ncbi:MAG: hypothetical protein GQ574_23420 [Crocinitomix sp.]|nr:hypothetical protein [Crocinitomix sp.]